MDQGGGTFFVADQGAAAGPFVVIKRMPERDGEFEYRVRSNYEPHVVACAFLRFFLGRP